ncbi:hypothetical protein PV328_011628 [Microctonus aethiopoides]|uniref:Follistatin n=1 Tax=Microctonus aethiopoides TaxID=144406 RepID=A0AA39C4W6_9HYME|nr:hypothetical protein PV328_011628 [Microctonus aethiopoides]
MKCKVPVYYTVVLLRQRQLVNVIEVIKVIKVINVVNVVKELVDIVNTIECCRRRRAPEMTVTRRGTAQPRFSNNHQHHRYKTFLLTPIIGLLLQTQNVTGGICWSSINNGKCKELLSQGVTRAECCASNAAAATAYSDEDLDSGSLFFWRVLGGGVHCRPCRESCAEVRCDEGKKCVVRRGRPRCVCSPECKISRGNSSAGPVCGTDGRSYRSLCRLKKHACKKATHQLSIAYNGYCQSSCSRVHCGNGRSCLLDQNLSPHCVKCARKCPPSSSHHVTSGRPVCGADGNTYKSACHLRLAACRAGRAIPIAYKGHCKQNADCTTIRCREGQTCLTEMHSSRPRCVTCTYRCPRKREKNRGRNNNRKREHRNNNRDHLNGGNHNDGNFGRPSSLLCATNNITYPSWCHIIKDACVTGFVLETKHAGPCDAYDIDIDNNDDSIDSIDNIDENIGNVEIIGNVNDTLNISLDTTVENNTSTNYDVNDADGILRINNNKNSSQLEMDQHLMT